VPDTFVDFREIKQRVSIEDVLGHYGIRLRRVNQNTLRGKCPLPTHSSEKSAESFSAHTGKNIWACQSASCASARQGKKGGNILDFVALMESCSIRDAAVKLNERFLSSSTVAPATREGRPAAELVSEKNKNNNVEAVNKPLSFALTGIDHTHPYLRQRGIKEATAKDFGVGLFSGKGSMSGRLVIPICNDKAELVAYAGRSLDDSEPKYKLPAGFHKGLVLFNYHRVLKEVEARTAIVLVEGFFDCMKVVQAGFPAVALMGSSLSEAQEELLTGDFERVILMLDGDEAGRSGADTIAARLCRKMFVRIVEVGEGRQPDQLSSDEIKTTIGSLFKN
jgi:DNA primase